MVVLVILLLSFSSSVMSNSSQSHGLSFARLPCSSLSAGVCANSCPLRRWSHPTVLSTVAPFSSLPQSFSASGSFPMTQLFVSHGQSVGASTSASVFPINIQGWFPLWLTGLISLLSKGLSRVFSNTTIRNHQFLALSLLYGPALTSIHDYWKNQSFEYTYLCQRSDVSVF